MRHRGVTQCALLVVIRQSVHIRYIRMCTDCLITEGQVCSACISIAPQGHSCMHRLQPLQ